MPTLPARPASARAGRSAAPCRRCGFLGLTAAAIVVLVAGAAWFASRPSDAPDGRWKRSPGAPVVDGRTLEPAAGCGAGTWLETDDASRARVTSARSAASTSSPTRACSSCRRADANTAWRSQQGTIHALIWAPPRFFFVNTPSAVAIDLGCAYTLEVDEQRCRARARHERVGRLRAQGARVVHPAGRRLPTRPGVGPGTPCYEDAPSGYAAALDAARFRPPDDPGNARRARHRAVGRAATRRVDALAPAVARHALRSAGGSTTGWRRSCRRREGVTREARAARRPRATDRWWNALGLDDASWWRMWTRDW